MKPTIGILGGIGPESSALFYKELINLAQSEGIKSNIEYPYILIESIPAPELLSKDVDLSMYKQGLRNLQKSGADYIVIVCNTAYVHLDKLKNEVEISLINLQEELEKVLSEKKIKNIRVFGSEKTIKNLFNFKNINVKAPLEEDTEKIEKIILDYNNGKNKEILKKDFIKIVKKYHQDNILIACTELSSIMRDSNIKYFDTFDILLNATFDRWKTAKD